MTTRKKGKSMSNKNSECFDEIFCFDTDDQEIIDENMSIYIEKAERALQEIENDSSLNVASRTILELTLA